MWDFSPSVVHEAVTAVPWKLQSPAFACTYCAAPRKPPGNRPSQPTAKVVCLYSWMRCAAGALGLSLHFSLEISTTISWPPPRRHVPLRRVAVSLELACASPELRNEAATFADKPKKS